MLMLILRSENDYQPMTAMTMMIVLNCDDEHAMFMTMILPDAAYGGIDEVDAGDDDYDDGRGMDF